MTLFCIVFLVSLFSINRGGGGGGGGEKFGLERGGGGGPNFRQKQHYVTFE